MRGRRFVRPELILHVAGGEQRKALAELDDKPWAAQDGDAWRATFILDAPLQDVGALELSVAPDIVVTLRGRPPRRRAPTAVRRPPIPLDTPAETGRLTQRLTTAEAAMHRERERRDEAEQSLERLRGEARQLSAELGRVRAELAIAQAADREAQATSELLDSSRREQHAAQARYDALDAEHERALGVQSQLRSELDSRGEELEALRAALDSARAELGAAQTGLSGRAPAHEPRAQPEARGPDEPGGPAETRTHSEMRVYGTPAEPTAPHSDRPLNPSLRSHSWPLRLLAVIVLAAVVIAVIVILQSTILH